MSNFEEKYGVVDDEYATKWVMREGGIVDMKDMSDGHIENASAMLKRHASGSTGEGYRSAHLCLQPLS